VPDIILGRSQQELLPTDVSMRQRIEVSSEIQRLVFGRDDTRGEGGCRACHTGLRWMVIAYRL